MKFNWNFLGEGGGAKPKTFHAGCMDIFWNYTLCYFGVRVKTGEDQR